ncbi:MAG TPA: TolC family outer membrane protein [Rhodocyclaceae bacterium]|nr:TolC family outer membrane protein [Rhodocyclaceae bacterium]
MRIFCTLISMAVLATAAPLAAAQVPDALRTAVQHAVDANPEVQTRWFAFRAAGAEQDSLRAGFRPSVDLAVGAGRAVQKLPGQSSRSFNRYGASLTLSQMLYDGFFTRNQVSRFGHVHMLRYFELVGDAERVALETFGAYVDVLRYRDLVQFAKENYVEHKVVYDQIVERTRSGIGRGVDLELATGRLALAESNLLTEVANLHDVSARYVRIVGEQPAETLAAMDVGMLDAELPASVAQALESAYVSNPSLRAAVANIRAGQDLIDTRRAAFHPRVDLRVRQELDRNLERLSGDSREGAIELILNYNLYRGGGDQARLRQAGEELNAARDTREKVCRDVRQTISIAYNQVHTAREQLRYLDQHQLSMAKAREAYRQQFEIGQRTLLDLLDGENEYFDARRAYANATYDQILAQARSLAGMGQLMQALGVARGDLADERDLPQDGAYLDPDSICPPHAPQMLRIDKEALLDETLRAIGRR